MIGKTLVEKAGTAVQVIVTDCEPVLELRRCLEIPVHWLAAQDDPLAVALTRAGAEIRPATSAQGSLIRHPHFPGDAHFLNETLDQLEGVVDLTEPFARIREAIGEARKMGITGRG